MSVCVRIRTNNRPATKDIFEAVAETDERLVVTSPDYPFVKVGSYGTALRGIEINEEDDGVEVRVCSFGSLDDYRLFGKAVKAVMDLSGGKAYYENVDEEEIIDPQNRFDEKWGQDKRKSSFDVLKVSACRYGYDVVLCGLFADICVGPRLFRGFDIDIDTENTPDVINRLQDYLINVQWHLADKRDTSTRSVVRPDPDDPEDREKTISMICLSEGKVNEFDYISYADILAFMDLDGEENMTVMVPFEKINKILPCKGFQILDEHQYKLTSEFTPELFHEIMNYARIFQPDNLMKKLINPGEGFDEEQKTVILMWNPAVSNIKVEDFSAAMPDMLLEGYNWSVWEHGKARCGDRFFLVRCGEGRTGIVMSGVFDSQPYPGRDWSGKHRKTYYMEMAPNVIINPETAPLITTAELEKAMPDFQWSGGHSGRILQQDYAMILEDMWQRFLTVHRKKIDGKTFCAYEQIGKL